MQRFSENDSTRWMTSQQVRWCLNMEKQDKIKKKNKKKTEVPVQLWPTGSAFRLLWNSQTIR